MSHRNWRHPNPTSGDAPAFSTQSRIPVVTSNFGVDNTSSRAKTTMSTMRTPLPSARPASAQPAIAAGATQSGRSSPVLQHSHVDAGTSAAFNPFPSTVAISGQDARLQADAAAAGSHRTGFIGSAFCVAGTSRTLDEDDPEVASIVPRDHSETLPARTDNSDGERRWADYDLERQNQLRRGTERLEQQRAGLSRHLDDLSAEV